MGDILTYVNFNDFLNGLVAGDLNFITGLAWLAIAGTFSIVGGAIGGILIGGKDLGYQLAAMIGGLFGPAAVLPAVLLGLLILRLT